MGTSSSHRDPADERRADRAGGNPAFGIVHIRSRQEPEFGKAYIAPIDDRDRMEQKQTGNDLPGDLSINRRHSNIVSDRLGLHA